MKKSTKISVLIVLGLFLVANSASALSLDYFTGTDSDISYNDTGADYVSLTDLVNPQSAPMIQLNTTIQEEYQHDYIVGIFEYDGENIDSLVKLNVLDTFKGQTSSNVIFNDDGTVDAGENSATMGTTFGFFIQFYSDLGSGNLTNEIYYSDDRLGTDHFSIFYDENGIASTGYSEVALGIGGPGTQGHALISIDDVKPVPEPATLVLMGLGLFGLAGFGRKKYKK